MPEIKTCERCGTTFKCRAEDIKNCQCYAVKISIQKSIEVKKQFKDCLCAVCLNVLAEKDKIMNK